MKISGLFGREKSVLSFEIFPPKQNDTMENFYKTIGRLKQLEPDYISVTFGAGGSAASDVVCNIAEGIKRDFDIEPLVHLTGIHHSKSDIMRILNILKQKGLENILALRGDLRPDMPVLKDFGCAADLITFLHDQGDIDIAAACYPEGHIESAGADEDIYYLQKKEEAGATHLISQMFFDNALFYSYWERAAKAGIHVPIQAGIMPVVNKRQIERMLSICNASLPIKFRRILDKYGSRPQALRDAGIVYAIDQIVDLVSNNVDGIHLFTMNDAQAAEQICKGISSLINVKNTEVCV